MSQSGLVDIEAANPQVPTSFTTDSGTAIPLVNVLEVLGSTVASATNATPLFTKGSGNTVTIELQVAKAISGAPSDNNDAGLVSFDDTAFSVDANGYVTLAGGTGPAIDSFIPDSGTNPVVASGTGQISILGSGSTTTVGSLNALTVQLTGLTNHSVLVGAGTTTITKVGPTSTAGQVLQSAGAAADPAFSTATYPLTTTINEILFSSATNTVTGLATANRAVLTTTSTGVPVLTAMTDGQLIIGSTAGAPSAALLAEGTGIDIANASNSITIAVDITEIPTVATSYTTDSGSAVPAAGVLQVLGGPGVTVSGATNVITINSVVYTDQAGSTSVVSDSGSFATNAITLTLPASPAQGERVEIIATNGIVTVTAAGTQVIHIGNDSTSAGGSCTGSATSDALQLIYQSSSDDWFALSAVGVWVLS